MSKRLTVPAHKVKEGDFLTGLGNGYVFTDPEEDPDVRLADGRFLYQVPGGDNVVMISFHDAEGEENYIICGRDNPVTVERRRGGRS